VYLLISFGVHFFSMCVKNMIQNSVKLHVPFKTVAVVLTNSLCCPDFIYCFVFQTWLYPLLYSVGVNYGVDFKKILSPMKLGFESFLSREMISSS
jgi:hypothetical protein